MEFKEDTQEWPSMQWTNWTSLIIAIKTLIILTYMFVKVAFSS
jgi:hypothetical protein